MVDEFRSAAGALVVGTAVVARGFADVQLIPGYFTKFAGAHCAILCPGQTLRVAVTIAVHGGVTGGVVIWDAAFGGDPQNLAG